MTVEETKKALALHVVRFKFQLETAVYLMSAAIAEQQGR
jgi:hypothetical protein